MTLRTINNQIDRAEVRLSQMTGESVPQMAYKVLRNEGTATAPQWRDRMVARSQVAELLLAGTAIRAEVVNSRHTVGIFIDPDTTPAPAPAPAPARKPAKHHPRNICPDCGKPGAIKGHMDCQYPQD